MSGALDAVPGGFAGAGLEESENGDEENDGDGEPENALARAGVELRFAAAGSAADIAVEGVGEDVGHQLRGSDGALLVDGVGAELEEDGVGRKILIVGALADENILDQAGVLLIGDGLELQGEQQSRPDASLSLVQPSKTPRSHRDAAHGAHPKRQAPDPRPTEQRPRTPPSHQGEPKTEPGEAAPTQRRQRADTPPFRPDRQQPTKRYEYHLRPKPTQAKMPEGPTPLQNEPRASNLPAALLSPLS